MAKLSAGLLMYRLRDGVLEVLLVHPGGPYWAKKDDGAWIPKGEYAEGEDPLDAARREFTEETGLNADDSPFRPLGTLRQPSGKKITAWAFEGDCDPSAIASNNFEMEWPPRSGRMAEFPEVDRAGWFPVEMAKVKLIKGQVGFIEELCRILI